MTFRTPPQAVPVGHHTQSAGYRPDIDGLRALAVFAVFIYHAFPKVLHGGFVGVDIFFVISGFLISSIIFSQLESTSFSFTHFYSRRIRRIYPVLFTVMAAVLVFGFCQPLINSRFHLPLDFLSREFAQLGKHVAGGAGFISNFLLWFESGYFDNAAETKPLLHLWSLGIEEQFYIIWPLLLWLLWKKRVNLFVVSLILAILSFGINLYFYNTDPIADFFSPLTRFWELLLGAMLAWVFLHPAQLTFKPGLFYRETTHDTTPDIYTRFYRYRHILSTAGVILLFASLFFIKQTSSRNYPGFWPIFPVLGTLLIIAAGKDGWFNKWVLSNRILVWFGLISYPLYLWHWPLISFARISVAADPPLIWRLMAMPLAVLLAWLTTKWIENPLRFGKHGMLKTISLFVVMVLLGLTGLFTYFKDGFPSRFPAPLLKLVSKHESTANDAYKYGCEEKPDNQFCPKPANDAPSKPVMAIWGDSHSAAISHGLVTHFKDRYNFALRWKSVCPPVFDKVGTANCPKNNQLVFQKLVQTKPQKVILSARWEWDLYADVHRKLDTTISRLREAGIHDIVIVGPIPVWKTKLIALLATEYMQSGQIVERMQPANVEHLLLVDREMAQMAKRLHVPYISPVQSLCNKDGCRTITGDALASAMTFDDDHLSGAGSDFLVSQFKDDPAFK